MFEIITTSDTAQTTTPRTIKDLFQVRCSRRWASASLLLGIGGVLAARRWGVASLRIPGILAGILLAYATMIEPRRPVLERHTITFAHLPRGLHGLRIGHLSDFHLGWAHTAANVRWAVAQMQREQPDLLVITGDFVSFRRAIAQLPELLRPLRAPLGIYAVTGNHDHWEGVDEIRSSLEPLGIHFLLNRSVRVSHHGSDFWVAGIDDPWYGSPDLEEALCLVPPDAFTLFLCHTPDTAKEAVHSFVDLQLSGHTHGGHISLPLLGPLCLPLYGLGYPSGWARVSPQLHLYVSRGLGGQPLRLNCPPEGTLITIQGESVS